MDRSLRGMRLGAYSLQDGKGIELAERVTRRYQTEDDETFEITFSSDADIPPVWVDQKTGREGTLLDEEGKLVEFEPEAEKAQRSHWDMLLERRTFEELEEVLQWRLDYLRKRKGQE